MINQKKEQFNRRYRVISFELSCEKKCKIVIVKLALIMKKYFEKLLLKSLYFIMTIFFYIMANLLTYLNVVIYILCHKSNTATQAEHCAYIVKIIQTGKCLP